MTGDQAGTAGGVERNLMKRVSRGSSWAAADLLDGYSGPVFRFILARVSLRREDAEEVLQDTFLAAMRSAATYAGQSCLLTWLCGIARHKVADFYRRTGRQPPTVEGGAGEDDPGDRLALREAIDLALGGLPIDYRQLLLGKYERGQTMAELAAEVGTTTKAVESRLGRARAAFAEGFQRVWGGEWR
ncbi:MAG TPA: RNA polymerase sigma factor [Bacillota bacterium]